MATPRQHAARPRAGRAWGRLRHQSFVLWQLPTTVFAAVLVVLDVVAGARGLDRDVALGGLATVAVATLVVVLLPWREQRLRWRLGVPLADLAGAVLIHAGSYERLPSAYLLCGLPVAWLAFYGRRPGALVGAVGALVTSVSPFLLDADLPTTTADRLDLAIPPFTVLGVALVALTFRGVLDRAQASLVRHTDDLARQVSMLNGVLEAADVAIGIYLPGVAPIRNGPALDLVRRSGGTVDSAAQGHGFYEADRRTRTPDTQRLRDRGERGEEFSGVLQWVGEPGDQVAIMTSGRQIRMPGGEHVGMVLVGWDVTDLQDTIRLREEMLANVSHELRTPLASIVGYLELEQDELQDADPDLASVRRMAAVMERNAHLLLSRIERLLAAAGDEHAPSVRPQPTDVALLTRDGVVRHRPAAVVAGLTLTCEAPHRLVANVDPGAYEQVFDNLVGNALKYTEEGGVVVSVATSDADLVLTVEDTGIGISENDRRHVFERFYRAESADPAASGLGLGLAITSRLVHLHHGRIDIASRLGHGTRVTVVLSGAVGAVDDAVDGAS